jgi:hypothetical protein
MVKGKVKIYHKSIIDNLIVEKINRVKVICPPLEPLGLEGSEFHPFYSPNVEPNQLC